MEGEVVAENESMLSLVRRLGFALRDTPGERGVVTVTREL
jgi:hypothetical protein